MKDEQKSKMMTELNHPERFTVLNDGWIKDRFTGLDLGPTSDKEMTLKQAEKYCANLGGRLPELYELISLVDYSKEEPAVYSILKDTKPIWYWSCTRTAWNKNAAWCVSFDYGLVNGCREDDGYYVRPVRASQ